MARPTRPSLYVQQLSLKPDAARDLSAWPHALATVKALGQGLRFDAPVTFFVGGNGSGKSTVLEALALALGFGAEGGTLNLQFSTTARAVSTLHEQVRVGRGTARPAEGFFLRAESFYNVATQVDEVGPIDSWGGRSLHERSHGEGFMTLLTTKLRGRGLYLLDEPEAALSVQGQFAALAALHGLVQRESQCIIATHSPILLAYPGARILRFDAQDGIAPIAYEATDAYVLTRDFLEHPAERVARLLDPT